MLVIQPLKKGTTLKQVKTVAASDDQSAGDAITGKGDVFSTPDIVGPGEKTTVIAKLPAGHYALLCFVPAPDGKSHAAHGMVKILDVSSAKSSLTPPKDGLVPITITDDAITLPASGVPGHGWAKVTNGSSATRNLGIGRYLTPSATFDDANAYFNQYFQSGTVPDGAPPEQKKVKPPRTHWDMLLERRSIADLEVLLAERLELLADRRAEIA
jgi:hypothetical protein